MPQDVNFDNIEVMLDDSTSTSRHDWLRRRVLIKAAKHDSSEGRDLTQPIHIMTKIPKNET